MDFDTGKTDWSFTIQYINQHKGIFTPLDIKNCLCNHGSTIAGYINFLRKYGYIERVGYGMYTKVEDIPLDITIKSITDIIYHPMFNRIKKLRNIKNKISENKI